MNAILKNYYYHHFRYIEEEICRRVIHETESISTVLTIVS